jgi:hypothetical protein
LNRKEETFIFSSGQAEERGPTAAEIGIEQKQDLCFVTVRI